jgi:thioredoxin reductase (NADPH)
MSDNGSTTPDPNATPENEVEIHDVVVIGSGPAGMSAALYAARANLDTVVLVGPQLGGQVAITWELDNYLGFHEDLTGPEFVEHMAKHVQKFGAELRYDMATAVNFDPDGGLHSISTYGGEIQARSVIVSAGASSRKLGVPGEEGFTGKGVSYCATCDGAFFKDHDVVVVGGGDSAMEEAIFLTRFAKSVKVVHRREELRAGPMLQERAFANDKIEFVWNTVIDEIKGNGKVDHVTTRRTDNGEEGRLDVTGVFIFIGHFPNSDAYKGVLDMDEHGYVIIDGHMRTSIPGVFACGEIADPVWRQVATSVGQGAQAGIAVEEYLAEVDAQAAPAAAAAMEATA